MGPGFESQRDHLMGQVDKNITCPIFFLAESLVQLVYQPYRFIDPRGSKIFAVKNQFSGKIEPMICRFLIVVAWTHAPSNFARFSIALSRIGAMSPVSSDIEPSFASNCVISLSQSVLCF
jgi:hypothetical protein